MNIKLNKVHICNYRSIKELTISLADFTLLFGMNDSGKSNINALKLALGIYR
jgi:predicted ATP-dependent endonuclease of OLD family